MGFNGSIGQVTSEVESGALMLRTGGAVHVRLSIQLGLGNPLERHPTVTTWPIPFRDGL